MKADRIHNFNAGPAALPLPVLEEIQESFLNFAGSGMSITEISHRSKWFDDVINDAVARVKRLLKLDDRYQVLFLQGGASMQFCMVPMNLLGAGDSADYVNTGTWSTKAIKEAEIQGKSIKVVASSEDRNFSYIPRDNRFQPPMPSTPTSPPTTPSRAPSGREFPDTGGVPIVSDMSSDIFSRPLEMDKFGLIYAGAQKNMGPAGVCLVIIRDDLLARTPGGHPHHAELHHLCREELHVQHPALLCHLYGSAGAQMAGRDHRRTGQDGGAEPQKSRPALRLHGPERLLPAERRETDSRSLMNVTFRLPSEDLEKTFVAEAMKNGMGGLKGHRSVGGCRASIYNPTPLAAVEALVDFMKVFEGKHG